jgi:pyruvate dehydrogenase E2 component (dihydrolipoamide acetyltransferase)
LTTKNITLPDIGGATDVDVIEVLVKVGDTIKIDSPLLTLESDKATMEVPSSDEGVVKELKVKAGDKVSTGSVIMVLETNAAASKEAAPKEAAESKPAPKAEQQTPPAKTEQKPAPADTAEKIDHGDVHAGPAVRKIAREFGIELSAISATGPKQRILKEDVQDYVKARLNQSSGTGSPSGLPTAPVVDFSKFGEIETKPLTRLKKVSGKNLHRNWLLVPHITQFAQADITEMEAYRQAQKAQMEKAKLKLTPLVFIMKAVVAALKAFPQFNASLDANHENLILKKYFHIGVAVDTPDGLVVPVIRDVDQKSLKELAQELQTISEKARQKQLTPNEMQGGCFSISSLGGIGGTAFTPIINVPEVAILGVSKASLQPVYDNDKFVPRLMLPLSLSYDHRVIDGADGARFVVYLTEMLSDIRNLLL